MQEVTNDNNSDSTELSILMCFECRVKDWKKRLDVGREVQLQSCESRQGRIYQIHDDNIPVAIAPTTRNASSSTVDVLMDWINVKSTVITWFANGSMPEASLRTTFCRDLKH